MSYGKALKFLLKWTAVAVSYITILFVALFVVVFVVAKVTDAMDDYEPVAHAETRGADEGWEDVPCYALTVKERESQRGC